jgi:aminoglycoside/choline kinase family phosphotransferase
VTSRASDAARLRALGLPEGLIDFLIRQGPSSTSPVRAVPLEGDASDRKYVRLVVEGRGEGDQVSYVLMQLSRPWVPQGSRRELPFVNVARHLSEKGIPVPRVFFDASEEGFVLLEDVGNVTLESRLERQSLQERRRLYESAIEILVRMQSEASTASSRPCYALAYSFDAETFFRELCFFREHALEGLWGHDIPADRRTELDGHFYGLCTEIAGYPKVFTHRDYHARNLMVQADRLTLLDFQDARLGPITYDLASLLRDSYVCLAPGEQEALIGHYREVAQRAGLACPDPDDFQRAFLRTGLQRNLKAIGTFAYQAVVKGMGRYLPSIPNTVDSVRSALEKDPELAPFRQALQPYVEGL